MKYKGRQVDYFSIGVELGKDKAGNKLKDFNNNEKFVADKLRQHVQELLRKLGYGEWVDRQIKQNEKDFMGKGEIQNRIC